MADEIRILQFGETGQLSRALIRLSAQNPRVRLHALSRAAVDFRYPNQVANAVRDTNDIDLVINAISYTAVDKAESDRDTAHLVNVSSLEALGAACRDNDIPLIHVSTDYVFDGTKTAPYVESDPTAPLNWYGRTKRDGERALEQSGVRHLTLRTTWLYSFEGTNFLKTMLRLGIERDELRVVEDQFGAPTYAPDLASAVIAIAERWADTKEPRYGVYHCTNAGRTTWCGFAAAIFETERAKGHKAPRLVPIATADYPTPARRPTNSCLNCEKIYGDYGIRLRPWRDAMLECLAEIEHLAAR